MSGNNLTQTLVKGLRVLECVASADKPLTAIEVAERCGFSRSTAYRLLITMEELNYVVRENESSFKIGSSVFLLSKKGINRDELPSIARPYLKKLSEKTGETALISTLVGSEVVSIARVESKKSVRIGSKVGSVFPIYCTATGKTILAYADEEKQDEIVSKIDFLPRTKNTITDKNEFKQHLKQVRLQGYAVDDRESDEEVMCMSVPVFDVRSEVVAAIGFSGVAFRVQEFDQVEIVKFMKQIANDLSRELGYVPGKRESE